MAWDARSGWKLRGSIPLMAKPALAKWPGTPVRDGNHPYSLYTAWEISLRLNGLGRPFGMETLTSLRTLQTPQAAKWPGTPVRDGNGMAVFPFAALSLG